MRVYQKSFEFHCVTFVPFVVKHKELNHKGSQRLAQSAPRKAKQIYLHLIQPHNYF